MAESGYLLLADITGYTGFMSDSELGHAKEIMESLINTIIEHLHPPLTLYKLEGDAVVAFSLDEDAMQGQSLLESIEHLYFAFHQELESSDRNTTCNCKACSNMKALDLKAVIHHGEFELQHVKATNQVELIGNNIIIAHRLLKNSIPEKTGVGAYAFFSEAATEYMDMTEFAKTMASHSETYEHIGEVKGFVYDLKPAWVRERERRRVFISHQDAYVVIESTFDVPQSIAWDYFTTPVTMKLAKKATGVSTSNFRAGRKDVGTTYHCAHGKNAIANHLILDWKPFSYITNETKIPGFGPSQYTIHFVPETKTRTLVKLNVGYPTHSNPTIQFLIKFLFNILKPIIWKFFKNEHDMTRDLIAKDKESGNLQMRMVTAEPQSLD